FCSELFGTFHPDFSFPKPASAALTDDSCPPSPPEGSAFCSPLFWQTVVSCSGLKCCRSDAEIARLVSRTVGSVRLKRLKRGISYRFDRRLLRGAEHRKCA